MAEAQSSLAETKFLSAGTTFLPKYWKAINGGLLFMAPFALAWGLHFAASEASPWLGGALLLLSLPGLDAWANWVKKGPEAFEWPVDTVLYHWGAILHAINESGLCNGLIEALRYARGEGVVIPSAMFDLAAIVSAQEMELAAASNTGKGGWKATLGRV